MKSISESNFLFKENILNEAIDTLENNLEFFSKDKFPLDWAMTQNKVSLISIFKTYNKLQTEKIITESIENFNEVLKIYDEKYFPNGFAETKLYIGIAYKKLAFEMKDQDKIQILLNALKSFYDAKKIYNQNYNPLKWIETQYNIAETFFLMGNNDEYYNTLNETKKIFSH